uniref:Uncharacterized protein n=1 Tax=Magallana gigas TaxID=29159 RepID=A0A8W8JHZ6_MAGGI
MESLVVIFIFIHGSLQTLGTTFTPCDKRRLNCCAGYMFEKNESICIKCPVGFIGPLCQTPCPFPFYGQFCQTRCSCERSECSNIEGCFLKRNAFVTPTSVVSKEEIIVYQNQDLDSKTSIYVSTLVNRVQQNQPPSTFVKQASVDPNEKASGNQNQDLGSSTDMY